MPASATIIAIGWCPSMLPSIWTSSRASPSTPGLSLVRRAIDWCRWWRKSQTAASPSPILRGSRTIFPRCRRAASTPLRTERSPKPSASPSSTRSPNWSAGWHRCAPNCTSASDMTRDDPAMQEFVDEARRVDILSAFERAGGSVSSLRRQSHEMVGPCPVHGGRRDKLQINPRDNVYLCRGDDHGGDAIGLYRHLTGADFLDACEALTGRDRPRHDPNQSPQQVAQRRAEAEQRIAASRAEAEARA
ncbi:MAG TPA: hypothetical protein DCX34_03515, partial [Roseovarius sp.]|nr:hypothetical protein [Roseovarius sp.]